MASVFWDSGVIHADFLPHGLTINVQYCRNLLHNNVQQEIRKKIPGKLSKKTILLHDNTYSHMAKLMTAMLATMGWKITNRPPYSSDIAPSNFNLSGPMNINLGQNFPDDDELKCSILKWLCYAIKTKPFMLLAPVTCQSQGKNVSV
jgi:hypothetical protein